MEINQQVDAISITHDTIYVPCRADKWRKCGNGRGFHLHGNDGNLENRLHSVSGHSTDDKCYYNCVRITSNTYKGLKPINRKVRENKFIFIED